MNKELVIKKAIEIFEREIMPVYEYRVPSGEYLYKWFSEYTGPNHEQFVAKIMDLHNAQLELSVDVLQKEKLREIEKYCKPHLELMWAARIVGIIKDCDFRDCEREIKKDEASDERN